MKVQLENRIEAHELKAVQNVMAYVKKCNSLNDLWEEIQAYRVMTHWQHLTLGMGGSHIFLSNDVGERILLITEDKL